MRGSFSLPLAIVVAAVLIAGAWIYTMGLKAEHNVALIQEQATARKSSGGAATLEEKVLPEEGVVLPVKWGNLGAQLVNAGVIDAKKFEALYGGRGGLTKGERDLLYGDAGGNLVITRENAGVLLNLLWAFGLANKNDILTKGPMMTYSGAGSPAEALAKAGNFASTGGWTVAKGNAMQYYSRYEFVKLTDEEQALVARVAQNIYRPCCDNATFFPDCNHGMAMLGLLELMASQGAGEDEMYRAALAVNLYWFPDSYLTIAKYMELKGTAWDTVNPREVLGRSYSSASGYRRILTEVTPPQTQSGGGCGV